MSPSVVRLAVATSRPPTICEVCPERPTCRTPCSRLEALIGPARTTAWREFGSDALVQGQRFAETTNPDLETFGRSKRLATLHGPRMRAAVDRLPPIQRIVVEGLFFDGNAESEMASRLGADVAFIRRLLSVGLDALRKEIGRLRDAADDDGRAQ